METEAAMEIANKLKFIETEIPGLSGDFLLEDLSQDRNNKTLTLTPE
jgi:hypothetical protein